MGSFRRKLFLILFFVSWLVPFQSLGWVKAGTTNSCTALDPSAAIICTEAITAVANTSVLNIRNCDNFTVKLHVTGGATSTAVVQTCNGTAATTCIDLHTSALDGSTIVGYTHGGPVDFIRGRVITAVPGGGTISLIAICAGSNN